jgi:hypothetical protein
MCDIQMFENNNMFTDQILDQQLVLTDTLQ